MGLLSRFSRDREQDDGIQDFHLVKRSTEGQIVETGPLYSPSLGPSRYNDFSDMDNRPALPQTCAPVARSRSPSPLPPRSGSPSTPAPRSNKLKAFSERFKRDRAVEAPEFAFTTTAPEVTRDINQITQSFPRITLTESFDQGPDPGLYYEDHNNSQTLLEAAPSFKSTSSTRSETNTLPTSSSSIRTARDDEDDQWVKRAEYMVLADSQRHHDLLSSPERARARSTSPSKKNRFSRLFNNHHGADHSEQVISPVSPTRPTRQGLSSSSSSPSFSSSPSSSSAFPGHYHLDDNQPKPRPTTPIFDRPQFALAPTSPENQKRHSAMLTSTVTHNLVESQLLTAIDLHEAGELTAATAAFSRLADPDDSVPRPGVPLAQVLYGMSLRHGWGCEADQVRAFEYLRAGAANSAIMDLAKTNGANNSNNENNKNHNEDAVIEKRRAAARKDMMLAIYELGNCFQYGWGTPVDAHLALTYYETAARLGDPDAMLSAAWCYLEGFGLKKKDKYMAAQYYRMAEEAGRGEVGNSWIWKEKYNKKEG